jgi:ATP-dependent Clp protease ATP-binding subunit ClpA
MNTSGIETLMQIAVNEAITMDHEYVCLEHITYAVLSDRDIRFLCESMDVDARAIQDKLLDYLSNGPTCNLPRTEDNTAGRKRTVGVERVFQRAYTLAMFRENKAMTAIDVLMGVLAEDKSVSAFICQKHGLTRALIDEHMDTIHDRETAEEVLRDYTTNLNEQAKKNKIDPLIGRATEVNDLVHVLARRKKNNCVLVGAPGTGKTAIAEGLAKLIVEQKVPKALQKKVVYSLDLAKMLAGTRYRGDFEERIKAVTDALMNLKNAVLFIDEIHMIFGAGAGSQGNVDAANIIKPLLGSGRLLTIGATTPDEYADSFGKDHAMSRRFTRLDINETNVEDTKLIVQGLKCHYEKFHGVAYPKALLDTAVELTDRYIKTRFFPDKALDVIDAAGARAKLANRKRVTKLDIIAAVSKFGKINEETVDVNQTQSFSTLSTRIKQTVYGQDEAVDAIVENILLAKSGLKERNKPIGSFLLLGSSGSGKTEVSRAVAKELGCELVKFDMSEFQEKHSVSKLIGAPPGYVGHGEGKMGQGQLLSQIENNPNSVLLLDEIEKAAPEVLQVLLQVMDDGRLTGATGNTVDFSNTVILMTSNLGARDAEKLRIGFGDQTNVGKIDEAVEKFFAPEFRNRLDAIVKFNPLDNAVLLKIVNRLTDETNSMLKETNEVKIKLTPAAAQQLATDGYSPTMGARPLKRVFQEQIKKPLSKMILFDGLAKVTITVDYKDGAYSLNR